MRPCVCLCLSFAAAKFDCGLCSNKFDAIQFLHSKLAHSLPKEFVPFAGITEGYAKLGQMVEQWKLIAAGAFFKGLPTEETQWSWDADAESTQQMSAALHDDGVSVLSDEECYEPSLVKYKPVEDDDSGLGKTDTMSVDSEGWISAESLLIMQQPAMHGMGTGDLIKLGTEQPQQQSESSIWGLCGLGSYFW